MRIKVTMAAAVLGAALTQSAIAADLPVKAAPVPVVICSWCGLYIGGQLGYAWGNSHYTLDNGVVVENFSHSPSSWIAGGHIGWQHQWNNVVLGIEGTWSATDLDDTQTSVLLAGRQRNFKISDIATIVGKLGFTWSPAMLLYIKGGYASANIKTFGINPATGIFIDLKSREGGWTLGGGLDYKLTPNWILGVDFNYYNFDFNRSGTASDGTPSRYFNSDANVYAITGRLSYLFNFGR